MFILLCITGRGSVTPELENSDNNFNVELYCSRHMREDKIHILFVLDGFRSEKNYKGPSLLIVSLKRYTAMASSFVFSRH